MTTQVRTVAIEANGRKLAFRLTQDADFIADQNTFYYLDRGQPPEPELIHLLARVLRPGDLAVDVGANVGFFSLLMAQLVGETGEVLAIEPGVNNHEKLYANIRANGFKNVNVLRVAAWDRDEEIPLYMAQDSGLNSLRSNGHALSSASVQGIPLPDILGLRSIPRLIKIDAEGSELHVLQGAAEVLPAVPYVVVEMSDVALSRFGCSREDIRMFMRDCKREMFLLHESGAYPTHVPFGVELKSEKQNLNALFSTADFVARAWKEATV